MVFSVSQQSATLLLLSVIVPGIMNQDAHWVHWRNREEMKVYREISHIPGRATIGTGTGWAERISMGIHDILAC